MKRRYDSLPSALSGNSPSANMPLLSSAAKLYSLGQLSANGRETWLLACAQLTFFEGISFWLTLSLFGLLTRLQSYFQHDKYFPHIDTTSIQPEQTKVIGKVKDGSYRVKRDVLIIISLSVVSGVHVSNISHCSEPYLRIQVLSPIPKQILEFCSSCSFFWLDN